MHLVGTAATTPTHSSSSKKSYSERVFALFSRVDPTRTTLLRKHFLAEVNRRFRWLAMAIRLAVVEKDVFALAPSSSSSEQSEKVVHLQTYRKFSLTEEDALRLIRSRAFDFARNSQKVDAFMDFLDELEQRSIIEVYHKPGAIRGGTEEVWSDVYVRSAYQKGIALGRQRLRQAGYDIPLLGEDIESDMQMAFNQPFHADRVGLLYTRSFKDLQGITKAMDTEISRTLAQGLMEGKNPNAIARDITSRVSKVGRTRARTLARTEVTRAHHLANVAEARAAGVLGVKVIAEWLTAGYRVCPICAALEGKAYTLDEIEGLIPAHPNCRCSFRPMPYDEWVREAAKSVPGVYGYLPDCHDVVPGKFLMERDFFGLVAKKCLVPKDKQKVKKAKASYKPATAEIQRAAEANEARLAKALKGGKTTGDNDPFDVIVGSKKNPTHLIEVKTIVRGKNSKITMHPESLKRKKDFAAKYSKAEVHTVVFDQRTKKIYYREGVGSFRLTQMDLVGSLKELNSVIVEGRLPGELGIAPMDGVAKNLRTKKAQQTYLKHKAEWLRFWEENSNLVKALSTEDQLPFSKLAAIRTALGKRKLLRLYDEHLPEWQLSPLKERPMSLKVKAYSLEKDVAPVVWPGTYETKAERQALKKLVSDDEYLNLRAFNQAYLEKAYPKVKKFKVYRGTDGRTGGRLVEELDEIVKKGQKTFQMTDSSIAGYSFGERVADGFGLDTDGVTLRLEVPKEDLILDSDLFSKITNNYMEEQESLILGKVRTVELKDVKYKSWLPGWAETKPFGKFELPGVEVPSKVAVPETVAKLASEYSADVDALLEVGKVGTGVTPFDSLPSAVQKATLKALYEFKNAKEQYIEILKENGGWEKVKKVPSLANLVLDAKDEMATLLEDLHSIADTYGVTIKLPK